MPEIGPEFYLWSIWERSGKYQNGFNGPVGLSAQELGVWADRCCIGLNAWEFSTVLEISRAYCVKLAHSVSPDEPPPYGELSKDFDRTKLAQKIRVELKAFVAASKKK